MIKNVLSIPKHSSNDDTNVNSSVDIPILNESPECRDEPSKECLSYPKMNILAN